MGWNDVERGSKEPLLGDGKAAATLRGDSIALNLFASFLGPISVIFVPSLEIACSDLSQFIQMLVVNLLLGPFSGIFSGPFQCF